MKYLCKLCNYETENKVYWFKHKNTTRHKKLENIESQKIQTGKENNIPKNFTEETEKLKKEHEIELLKEKLRAIENEKNNIEKQLQNQKIMFEKQLQLTENQLRLTEEHYKGHIETLKSENDFQKKLINSAGGIIKKSMNTLSFLLTNYNNAPYLCSLDDYSILSKNIDYLIKDLIFYQRKNKLDKYLGDFIVKHYKKENPELQAIWNSDTERLNYFIRELYNIKNNEIEFKNSNDTGENKKIDIQWIVDRKGLKMTKCIINPLLDYICKLNANYLNIKHKENEDADLKEKESILKDMETLALINCDIKNHNLSKNINKYIAPHFYLDKNNYKAVKNK